MAHILGVLAVLAFLLSFQLKKRQNIILVNIASRIFYILQYIFLGALEGAVLDFSGFVFSFLARYKEKPFVTKHLKIIIIAVNVLLIAVGLSLYENVFSLFAIGGIVLEIMALWLTKEKNIRLLSLACLPFWLTYNIANGAYSSAVGNVLGMVSIALAMLRLDFKKTDNE